MHRNSWPAAAIRLAAVGFATIGSAAIGHAAQPAAFYTNADHSIVYANSSKGHLTPPLAHRSNAPIIDQDFAILYPKGLYNATAAFALSGPNSLFGQLWLATAFTPAATEAVSEVDVPLGITFGTQNLVEIHIYADAAGMPGAELWKHRVALEQSLGECCNVTAIHLKVPVQLTAGTQYWLGVTTLANEPEVLGFWNLDVLDQVNAVPQAVNRGQGWVAFDQAPTAAFGIYGK